MNSGELNDVRSSIPHSGPLIGGTTKKSARFKEDYVEITMDVKNDMVSILNIEGGDQEATLLAKKLERSAVGMNISSKLKQVSQELRRITSSKRMDRTLNRSKSCAAQAIKGLQFLNKNVRTEGWAEVERRFNDLAVDGLLLKSRFGRCVGKILDSTNS